MAVLSCVVPRSTLRCRRQEDRKREVPPRTAQWRSRSGERRSGRRNPFAHEHPGSGDEPADAAGRSRSGGVSEHLHPAASRGTGRREVNWIDISMPLRHDMEHWPRAPAVVIERFRRIESGEPYNLTTIAMSAHTGTHVDAPLHFIPGGLPIDKMPVDALIGPATVVEGLVVPESSEPRVLFRCGGELTPEIAHRLAARGVRAAGIDSLSIGDDETHRILLGAGIWVIEGLDLSAVEPGRYELMCLALRIEGADGAPARALLRALT